MVHTQDKGSRMRLKETTLLVRTLLGRPSMLL